MSDYSIPTTPIKNESNGIKIPNAPKKEGEKMKLPLHVDGELMCYVLVFAKPNGTNEFIRLIPRENPVARRLFW